MSESTISLLQLMAEVAIATVALSGITMVLAVSGTGLSKARASQVAAQMGMSFIVVVFAIFPLVVERFQPPSIDLWRISSGVYLTVILAINSVRLIKGSIYSALSNFNGAIVTLTASCGAILLIANLWLVTDWPYLTQLFIAWVSSMVLFLAFIYRTLSEQRD